MLRINATLRKGNTGFGPVVTGAAADIVNKLINTTFNSAVQRAPKSGWTERKPGHIHIRGNHKKELASPGRNIRGAVINEAPHAKIIHDGRGPISSNNLMIWTNSGGPFAGEWRLRNVGPAAANPWLVDAYNRAREIHNLNNVRPMNRNRRPV